MYNMAMQMFYRGPSSRLETLIEKIQQNNSKESSHTPHPQDIYSSRTSTTSFSPSPSDDARTPNSLIHSDLPHPHYNRHLSHPHPLQHQHLLHPTPPNHQHPLHHLHQPPHAYNPLQEHAGDAASTAANIGGGASADGESISAASAAASPTTTGSATGSARAEGTYQCQFCEKSFPRLGYLKKHEQSHAEHMPFKCDYCARLFKHKRSRDRHTKLHTGDRRYRCPHCEAAFSRSDHLKIHMKTHDNQKPFQCTVCNRGYNTAAALTSHMQNHKKQQAAAMLNGSGGNGGNGGLAPGINYSPRSTGSTGSASTASSNLRHQHHHQMHSHSHHSHHPMRNNKRKYSPTLLAHRQQPAATASDSSRPIPDFMGMAVAAAAAAASAKRPQSDANADGHLYCMYCTQHDFQSLEQLHAHIQTAHSTNAAATAAMHPPSSTAPPASLLCCEFCTMRFDSLPQMFQHIKSTHIDRVPSPSAYTEHLHQQHQQLQQQQPEQRMATTPSHPTPPAQSEPLMSTDMIKTERAQSAEQAASPQSTDGANDDMEASAKRPRSNDNDSVDSPLRVTQIKQEAEQECPTDLSKKSVSVSPMEEVKDGEEPALSDADDCYRDDRRSASTPKENSPPPAPTSAPQSLHSSPKQSESGHRASNEQTPNRVSVSLRSAHPGPFLCNQCNAALPDFDAFRTHLKAHVTQNMAPQQQQQQPQPPQQHRPSPSCAQCGHQSASSAEHEHHVCGHFLATATEHQCRHSECSGVEATFGSGEALQKHLLEAHTQCLFRCTVCADLFETRVAIQVHMAVAHASEHRVLLCSVCGRSAGTFRSDSEFRQHVRQRHLAATTTLHHQSQSQQMHSPPNGSAAAPTQGSVQCVFCRHVCANDIEMHFHLAAHARPFRCPACPESFHVEFLLDRHMQTQHNQHLTSSSLAGAVKEQQMAQQHQQQQHAFKPAGPAPASATTPTHQQQQHQHQNNNNNILDYHYAAAAAAASANIYAKFYANSTPSIAPMAPTIEAGPAKQHPLYGFYDAIQKSARFDPTAAAAASATTSATATAKSLLGMYRSELLAAKLYADAAVSPANVVEQQAGGAKPENGGKTQLICGICEKRGFASEAEVQTHRKVVHNVKTGVSLKCAYCSGNFRSRHDLENHMKIAHNGTGKHKCLICDAVFPSPAVLAEHKLTHSKVAQSGQCARCAQPLADAAAFRAHMAEHGHGGGEIPTQCVCCRQTLHSEFEVDLHAKFHTNSSGRDFSHLNNHHSPAPLQPDGPTCALCLHPLPPTAASETKICDRCYKKHNLGARFPLLPSVSASLPPPPLIEDYLTVLTGTPGGAAGDRSSAYKPMHSSSNSTRSSTASSVSPFSLKPTESTSTTADASDGALLRCNLCATSPTTMSESDGRRREPFATVSVRQLQLHLIEHSFEGCVERGGGYACYICAAVFTAAGGLQQHMHEVHGEGAKPYDCAGCAERFFFRAELQHHSMNGHQKEAEKTEEQVNGNGEKQTGEVENETVEEAADDSKSKSSVDEASADVQEQEKNGDESDDENSEKDVGNMDDEEYIEVEKLGEMAAASSPMPSLENDHDSNGGERQEE